MIINEAPLILPEISLVHLQDPAQPQICLDQATAEEATGDEVSDTLAWLEALDLDLSNDLPEAGKSSLQAHQPPA